MIKVVVGLSGGVDSAVSAYLLKEQGYDVTAVFMQNWQEESRVNGNDATLDAKENSYCSQKVDSLDAIAVADVLGIDIEIVNFAQEYKELVFSYFLKEYRSGRTPNPDILCNSEIKFKVFLDYARSLGADFIATGHYAGLERELVQGDGGEFSEFISLKKALDLNKDQSYFLYRLTSAQLKNAIFPLAQLCKPQVRELAAKIKLPNAQKKDSTGICFIGERPFRQFLQQYLPLELGAIIDPNGKVIGEHEGLMYYTIGQRKGLNIGGAGEPWYVVDKNLTNNQLIVAQGVNHPLLFKSFALIEDISSNVALTAGQYTVKLRYRMEDVECQLCYQDAAQTKAKLIFAVPQRAVTPGQSAVLYSGNSCVGGGVIVDAG